jgi:ABC-2 type transport system permease protein
MTTLTSDGRTAPTPHGAPPATSTIPFTRLLRVEWLKAIDTRASRWLLAVVALTTVGMMVVHVLATRSFDQTIDGYLSFTAFAVSLLLPVMAVLVMTSEWSQRTVLTTFTQEPRRHRVLFAKMGAAGILTGIACGYAAAVSVIALSVSTGLGHDVSWHLSPSVGIGLCLDVALNVAIGVGLGVLLQKSTIAIVAIFALPTAFSLLATALHSAGQWIDSTVALDWVAKGEWGAHAAKIVVAMLLWIALPITAGIVRTVRREIS